jgi:hypothetical protein
MHALCVCKWCTTLTSLFRNGSELSLRLRFIEYCECNFEKTKQ